jgi:2-dehydro-3-deoxyphosphooctonate aldolase (KDO 8-P synthase)
MTPANLVNPVKPLEIAGTRHEFVWIAGPCVVESQGGAVAIAEKLAEYARGLGIRVIFKASIDKANRTSGTSPRGCGYKRGLLTLEAVKARTGLPVLTDIHEPWQAESWGDVVDAYQIPALLCRQTDLLVAAARTGKPVNVKKGQFMSHSDMVHVVEKLRAEGCGHVLLTERGNSFGYNNVVVDFRGLATLATFGCPVVFDASHTVQSPGGQGARSGGDRRLIIPMARAAAAFGCHGIFVEVHPDPDNALSDGPSSLRLDQFEQLVSEVQAVRRVLGFWEG